MSQTIRRPRAPQPPVDPNHPLTRVDAALDHLERVNMAVLMTTWGLLVCAFAATLLSIGG